MQKGIFVLSPKVSKGVGMDKPFALIIEDDRDIASLFRHIIDIAGYRTEIAFHGQAAIERLRTSKPEIVILDLNLPGVTGNDILSLIRKDQRLTQTKIIVATAHAYMADSLSYEPDLILLKPVSLDQLTRFVKRFSDLDDSQKTAPIQGNPWDESTDLYNKSFFMHRLESSLRQAKEIDDYIFAMLSFKLDQKGPLDAQSWDLILRKTAETVKNVIRPYDTFARFEQGNFHILCENLLDEDTPKMIATRIETALNKILEAIGFQVQMPITISITHSDNGYEKIEKILHDAKKVKPIDGELPDISLK